MTQAHITKDEFHKINRALEFFMDDIIFPINNENAKLRLYFLISIMQNEAERMIE